MPAPTLATARTVDICAGPGGWEEAARILGGTALLRRLRILGVEIDRDACATAAAAGHRRLQADMTTLNPRHAKAATGLIASPPCPTFSSSGKQTGMGDDYQHALDAITALGSDDCGPDCDQECWRAVYEQVTDPRTALVVEAARWALTMPNIEWMVAEQVPGVEELWESLVAELSWAGWEAFDVVTFDAEHLGTGSRRKRTYIAASRYRPTGVSAWFHPDLGPGARSMADVLAWPEGERINTRGNRRTSGGNEFSADKSSWCITGKARTWKRVSDGATLTADEAGVLNGFPVGYPWSGSRTSQFQQAADVVAPPAGAWVLGAALGIDPRGPLTEWASERTAPSQLVLSA